jgi:hypothetical protein
VRNVRDIIALIEVPLDETVRDLGHVACNSALLGRQKFEMENPT